MAMACRPIHRGRGPTESDWSRFARIDAGERRAVPRLRQNATNAHASACAAKLAQPRSNHAHPSLAIRCFFSRSPSRDYRSQAANTDATLASVALNGGRAAVDLLPGSLEAAMAMAVSVPVLEGISLRSHTVAAQVRVRRPLARLSALSRSPACRVHCPRPQRPARALLRARRPSWACSTVALSSCVRSRPAY